MIWGLSDKNLSLEMMCSFLYIVGSSADEEALVRSLDTPVITLRASDHLESKLLVRQRQNRGF